MEKSEKIIEKIVKLIKKSESAKELGSVEEAEIFAQKAQELLQKYNLSKDDLTEEEKREELTYVTMEAKVPSIGGRSSFDIMAPIAEYNFCKAYTYGRSKNNQMVIVGSPENIEICRYIHSTVLNVFLNVGKQKYKEYVNNREFIMEGKVKPVGLDTFMRTFLTGCKHGLRMKLREEQEKFMSKAQKNTDIIRTNEVILEDFATSNWGRSGTEKRRSTSNSGNAYSKGVETGKSVKIKKGVGQATPIQRKQLK